MFQELIFQQGVWSGHEIDHETRFAKLQTLAVRLCERSRGRARFPDNVFGCCSLHAEGHKLAQVRRASYGWLYVQDESHPVVIKIVNEAAVPKNAHHFRHGTNGIE